MKFITFSLKHSFQDKKAMMMLMMLMMLMMIFAFSGGRRDNNNNNNSTCDHFLLPVFYTSMKVMVFQLFIK